VFCHACLDSCNPARAEALGGGLILVAVAGLAGGSMPGGGLVNYRLFVGSVGFVGWGWRVFTRARSNPNRRPWRAWIERGAVALVMPALIHSTKHEPKPWAAG